MLINFDSLRAQYNKLDKLELQNHIKLHNSSVQNEFPKQKLWTHVQIHDEKYFQEIIGSKASR